MRCGVHDERRYSDIALRVTATSPEAFIARLYREKNKTGFLKAFTDQPEHITSGMSPLRSVLKELQLRTVHVYPRCVVGKQHQEKASATVILGFTRTSQSLSGETDRCCNSPWT